MLRSRLLLFICVLGVTVLLVGCLQGEQTIGESDIPEEVTLVDEELDQETDSKEGKEEEIDVIETEETVARELYLIDETGLVVPQTMELPKTKSAAMQSLEYLVKDGPVTELLPNGFQAVLPAGTEIFGVNLKEDGTLIVDLSEDFTNYEADNELKILQAMTHTLTQFESVDRIKLWINGENLTEMPVNGTPLTEGYSRANGINIDLTEKPDLKLSKAVTMYYPKTYEEDLKFIPVTKYLNLEAEDLFTSIVQAMLDGPSYTLKTQDVFNDQTTLVQKPFLENGVLQLEFSEEILKDAEDAIIADEVMETLVRTLSEQTEVEAVKVSVKDVPKLIGENGSTYDEPITVQQFESTEKM